jgi:ABC-2 type transport system ATP-binding protein
VTGLLGPNGAGKTTAIRVLLGLARATSGWTEILGARPESPGFAPALRATGSLIEGPALYGNATGRQNLEIQAAALGMPDAEARPRHDEVLELVGLADRAGDRAKSYSLGMKQRLGLAVALLGRPRVVVLDEPTNGLDPAGIVEIRALIMRLPEAGTTVLVSSHLLAEVQLMCDRLVILHRGRTIAAGTMAEVLARGAGTARVDVTVEPGQAEPARRALAGAGLPTELLGDGRLAVAAEGRPGSEINRVLVGAGIYADELRRAEARLEDVFLALTDDGAAGAGDAPTLASPERPAAP